MEVKNKLLTAADAITIVLITMLKGVYPKGNYSVQVVHDPMTYRYKITAFITTRFVQIALQSMYLDDMFFHQLTRSEWHHIVDVIHVSDETKAKLMLLSGDTDD